MSKDKKQEDMISEEKIKEMMGKTSPIQELNVNINLVGLDPENVLRLGKNEMLIFHFEVGDFAPQEASEILNTTSTSIRDFFVQNHLPPKFLLIPTKNGVPSMSVTKVDMGEE